MPNLTIQSGDLLQLKSMTVSKQGLSATYKPPRGEVMVVLLLGSRPPEKGGDDPAAFDAWLREALKNCQLREWPAEQQMHGRQLNCNQLAGQETQYRVIFEQTVSAEEPEAAARLALQQILNEESETGVRVEDTSTGMAYTVHL